jgi:hypothetical protein
MKRDHEVELHIIKWEFLRRSSGYKEDHAAFLARHAEFFSTHGLCLSRTPNYKIETIAMRRFLAEVAEDIEITSEKWGLFHVLPPPEKSYPEITKERFGPRPYFFEPERGVYWSDLVNQKPDEVLSAMTEIIRENAEFRESRYRFQYVMIDVTQPVSRTLEWVKQYVSHGQDQYERNIGPLSSATPLKRARIDKFAKYLQVWDLRTEGMKFEQIAKIIYQAEYKGQRKLMGKRYLPVVQKVRDDYKRAAELINGGYQEIS